MDRPDLAAAQPTDDAASRVGRPQYIALAIVLAIYVALALRLLTLLPLWGPVLDEPIYFGYAKYVAVTGRLPQIQNVHVNRLQDYYTLPSAGDAGHHPPGYFLLGALVLRAMGGGASLAAQNYALRGLSLALGLGALLMLFFAVKWLVPRSRWLPVGVTAVVAFFPEWLLVSSVIYLEAYGGFATCATLLAIAWYLRGRGGAWPAVVAGACAGLMALTKYTVLPFCVAAGASVFVIALRRRRSPGQVIGHVALFALAALAVAGWWYGRNVMLYGRLLPTSDELLGTTQHTRFVMRDGSPDMIAMLFLPQGRAYWRLAFTGAFKHLWSPSDWLPESARAPMYGVGGALLLGSLIGLIVGLRRRGSALRDLCGPVIAPWMGALVLLFGAYLHWTLEVSIQATGEFGKFVMPAIGPLGFIAGLSLRTLAGRWAAVVALLAIAFLLTWDALAVHHIATVLIPLHAGSTQAP